MKSVNMICLKKWLFCIALLATVGMAAQAQEPPPVDNPALLELQDQLEQLGSASGQFEQMIREQDGYLLDRQTGSFNLQKPRQLRWHIKELDQLLVSDGEVLYLYDELFQQVTLREWSSDPAVNPAAILLDDIWLGDWANVSKEAGSYLLQPFGRATSIRSIELQMEQGFPSVLRLEDFSGQVTEIRFSDVVLNEPQEASLFEFEIPAGVEVIYDGSGS